MLTLRRSLLLISIAAMLNACATSSSSHPDGPSPDAPAWFDAERPGMLVGRGRDIASGTLLAETTAMDRARGTLSMAIEGAIADLVGSLRPVVAAVDGDGFVRRFDNARHLAASEALRAASVARRDTFLEPSGKYSAFVVLTLDADDPAYFLHEELQRIDGLPERLAGAPVWRTLEDRAAARRAERASDSPLPPVGGR